ncbi:hypothetical protein QM327_22640 [Pantoea dispersa]|uniref:hypothetical protein n=1 Tax=Pantoea dispersa TaxID=59814 RepID=UPI0024B745B3|nr:hypothetical protein [Pantoea dispersa]MDI9769340.1 hypothetical protein [Pantoea dispersa]
MGTTYKITYERRDGNLSKQEEILFDSETEPTPEEVHEVVRRDTARFHKSGMASYSIISVEPVT